ncbi:hypothetical protein Tco_0351318 [Tanacetum coccineum]
MSTPEYIYPIIILSDSDVEDTFSSTHSPDYIPALSDYSLASPGNTSPNFSDDLTKDLLSSLSISPFHDDLRIQNFSVISYNMPPKRTSTSEASAMTHAAIRKLAANSVVTALEAQDATMASTNNPNSGPRKTPVARNNRTRSVMELPNLSTSLVRKMLMKPDMILGLNFKKTRDNEALSQNEKKMEGNPITITNA